MSDPHDRFLDCVQNHVLAEDDAAMAHAKVIPLPACKRSGGKFVESLKDGIQPSFSSGRAIFGNVANYFVEVSRGSSSE